MRSLLLFLLLLFCAQPGKGQGYEEVDALRNYIQRGERNDARRIIARIQTESPSLLSDLLPEIETLYDLEWAEPGDRDSLLGLYQTILKHSDYNIQRKVLLKRMMLVETMPQVPIATRLACYEECYAEKIREMSAEQMVAWGRLKLQSESWDKVLMWFNDLFADFEVLPATQWSEGFDFAALKRFFEKELNPLVPDCSRMAGVVDSMAQEGGLSIYEAQVVLSVLGLKWCDQEGLAARARRILEQATDANSYQLLALYALNHNQPQQCYPIMEKWIAAEQNPLRKVGPSVNLAIFYLMENRLADARRLMEQMADRAPEFGEGWMMQGKVLELAAEQCEYAEFDKKAMYWLAAEYYMKAKNLDEWLAAEADRAIYRITQLMPTPEEYGFRGLQVGDTYPLKCWGSHVTHVR